ncbi:unnamed protein product [Absidia cylindrospora]
MHLGWPVTLGDIRRWSATFRLPYLHLLKDIPDETLELVDLRSIIHILQLPSTYAMQRDTLLLLNAFTDRTTLLLPEPNTPLLIYRYCTQLFLPVEMYFCARTMYEEYRYLHPSLREDVNHGYHKFDCDIMVIVLILAKLCYGLDDVQDIDPVYQDATLPPPLPKNVWLEHIRANAARWEHVYQSKMIDSPDIELDLIIDFLKNSVPQSRLQKKEKKSLVRRHILKMQNSLGSSTSHRSNWSSDILMDTSKLVATIHDDEENSSAGGTDRTKTKTIGDIYMTLDRHYTENGKWKYPNEEELVVRLASRILGCDTQFLQSRVVLYENYLKNLK